MNIKYFYFNSFMERCIVASNDHGTAVIMDPGCTDSAEREKLYGYIDGNGLKPAAILLTHAHFDHIFGVKDCIRRYNIPVYMHPADNVVKNDAEKMIMEYDMEAPDTSWDTVDISDGEILNFDGMEFEVIWTPGHSPGSVCYLNRNEKELFSGDTLFAGTIGRTDFLWGEYDDEIRSVMDKLIGLDPDIKVHPGHGGGTTIGYERTHNPFLQPFNYKDEETGYVDGIEFR